MPEHAYDRRAYAPAERPPVQVEDGGSWFDGWLHTWIRDSPGGPWRAVVSWRTAPGLQLYQAVPAARVRKRVYEFKVLSPM